MRKLNFFILGMGFLLFFGFNLYAQDGENTLEHDVDNVSLNYSLEFENIDNYEEFTDSMSIKTDVQSVNCLGVCYFIGWKDVDTWNLYGFDGHEVRKAKGDIFKNYDIREIAKIDNSVYVAVNTDDGNRELCKIDFNDNDFSKESRSFNLGDGLFFKPKAVIAHKGLLYVVGRLRKEDVIVKYDWASGSYSQIANSGDNKTLTLLGGAGDFIYYEHVQDGKLYSYNINTANTERLANGDLKPKGVREFCTVNGLAYFLAGDNEDGRIFVYVWRSDGTAAGTVAISDKPPTNSSDTSPALLINVKDRIYYWGYSAEDEKMRIISGYARPNGQIVKDGRHVLSGFNVSSLRSVNNTLFYSEHIEHLDPPHKTINRCDGARRGTWPVFDFDTNESAWAVGMANGRILILLQARLQNGDVYCLLKRTIRSYPKNVKWAGLRCSYYGILDEDGNPPFPYDKGPDDGDADLTKSIYDSKENTTYHFPHTFEWELGAKAIASYFPASKVQPTLIWIVSRPEVVNVAKEDSVKDWQYNRAKYNNPNARTVVVNMGVNTNNTYSNSIRFEQNPNLPTHEDYLDQFDAAGVKVLIQLEPGWAKMIGYGAGDSRGLLDLVLERLIREDQDSSKSIHECVIGIGLDVEWYENIVEGVSEIGDLYDNCDGMGNFVRDGDHEILLVVDWYKRIRDAGQAEGRDLKMFLKHWTMEWINEDANHNGILDPGEDQDIDGFTPGVIDSKPDPGNPWCFPDYEKLGQRLRWVFGGSDEELKNIIFVNDSQGARFPWWDPSKSADEQATAPTIYADDALKLQYIDTQNRQAEFLHHARNFYKSPVGYQILYPNDWVVPRAKGMSDDEYNRIKRAGWLHLLDDEASGDINWMEGDNVQWNPDNIPPNQRWKLVEKLGNLLAEGIKEQGYNQDVGIFVVDFRARLLYPDAQYGIFDYHTPPADNYALEKQVTVSSMENSTFDGKYAVDGNPATRWASIKRHDPEWIVVDLKQKTDFKQIVLKWGDDFASKYKILVSDNGTTWKTLYTENAGNGGEDNIAVSGSARYVCMYGLSRGTTQGYSLSEFEIYDYIQVPDEDDGDDGDDQDPQDTWKIGTWYNVGKRVVYKGIIYECTFYTLAQEGYEPDRPELWAIWKRIGPA